MLVSMRRALDGANRRAVLSYNSRTSAVVRTGTRSLASAPQFFADDDREEIVVLGCGWAGYKFIMDIDARKYKVKVVSPRNHFLFTPLLASASVGGSDIESICQPIRPLVSRKEASFFEAYAEELNKEKKYVMCRTVGGTTFPVHYDKLIINVGYQANDFNIPNLGKHAFFMKETGDAKRLHDHILHCFEEASFIHMLDGDEHLSEQEDKEIRDLLSFVVVGGGPTGTEFAGELSEFLKNDIPRMYPHLQDMWTVRLVDGMNKLLGPFQDDNLSQVAKTHLENEQGVKVHLNEFVDEILPNKIKFKSGNNFPFSTLVWCAGIKPVPFSARAELTMNERNSQILTDRLLRVKGEEFNDIYALGDCATIENFWLPQTAQIAGQQGTYLAKALNSDDPTDFPPFQNVDRGSLAYLGGTAAVYKVPGFLPLPNFTGRLGWFTWKSAYWSLQLSMRNRVMLTMDWVFNYFFGRDLTRTGRFSDPTEKIPCYVPKLNPSLQQSAPKRMASVDETEAAEQKA